MNRKLSLGLGIATVCALALSNSEAGAKDMNGWIFSGGSGDAVSEGAGHNMYNTDQKAFVDGKNRWGVNLGWASSPQKNVALKKKSGGGPILCGELFAIKVDKEWLMYYRQNVGINLSTRTAHKDEWAQWKFAGCTAGQAIPKNQPVTLVNTVANDSLVGCKRAAGVNLCWAGDVESRAGINVRLKGP